MKIVIGIDPGTATTGFGIIEVYNKKRYNCLDYGVIKTSSEWNPQERLKKINDDFTSLIKKYNPKVLAIESLFFFKNAKTAIPVSQARGVLLNVAAQKNIETYEFTPLQAKIATVGYGRAEKKQVQEMVKIILKLNEIPKPDDAADALAVAICYIHSSYKE
jgi:crossover junction endodeoxyribonuclease RuvC